MSKADQIFKAIIALLTITFTAISIYFSFNDLLTSLYYMTGAVLLMQLYNAYHVERTKNRLFNMTQKKQDEETEKEPEVNDAEQCEKPVNTESIEEEE